MPASKSRRREERREKRRIIRQEIKENLKGAKADFMITLAPGVLPIGQQVLDKPAWEAAKNMIIEEAKKMAARELFSFRLYKGLTKQNLTQLANSLGLSPAELINGALGLFLGFDPEYLKQWQTLASRFNYPVSTFMQNIIIDWVSERGAEEEVFGFAQRKDIFAHSVSTEGKEKPITGDLFKKQRDAEHLKAKELELANNLIEKFERQGEPVPEEQGRWVLIKHRMGKTWMDSPEYKKWQEERPNN